MKPADFQVGDKVKFYDGDDVSVTYGMVVKITGKSCDVSYQYHEQEHVARVRKDRLNFD